MIDPFDFFEQNLHERRTYRCSGEFGAWRYQWMKKWDMDDLVTGGKVDVQDADFTFTGTHRLNTPGSPLGVARVNERFNITLPADFDAFYRRWDGGVLLFRELYPLLSVEQMLQINGEFAEANRGDAQSPVRLIRFCDMHNEDYLCLRLGDDGTWQVIFKSCEYPDSEYFLHWDELQASILDATFTAWLQRMTQTDGWPLKRHGYYNDEIVPPTERVE